MEQLLKEMLSEIKGLKEGQNHLLERVTAIESTMVNIEGNITAIESNMATKEDIEKLGFATQDDVKSILHLIEKKTDVLPRIEAKLEVINDHMFEQEADICLLKKVK